MPQTWCGGLITPIYKSGGPEVIRQTTCPTRPTRQTNYLCLQLPGKTVLFYLKPTTSRVYSFFEYAPHISNWRFTE